jgi:hypothetical protein
MTTAPASAPAPPPAAPPAANDGATPPATPPATQPAAQPGLNTSPPQTFSWDSPLPSDGLPAELESLRGKTWNDVANSYRELRQQVSKKGTESKSLQEKIAEHEATIKTLQDKNGQAALGEVVQTSLVEFFQTGQINDEAIQKITSHWGVDKQTVSDFYAFLGQKRTAFVDKAAQEIGESGTPEAVMEVMEWVQGAGSPYTEIEQGAFEQAYMRGDPYWVKAAHNRYQEFLANGGQRPQIAAPAGQRQGQQQRPTMAQQLPNRGTRPSETRQGDYYLTQAEYRKDDAAAEMANDPVAKRRVRDKLIRTPEHIRKSPDWLK